MANIKTITKKLVNLGFSENKLMMMTEKEIREAYKVAKEESTMKNDNNTTTTNNSTTVEREEITMMRTTQELINDALNIKKIQDKKYVTNEMLRAEYKKLTDEVIGIKTTRMVIITKLQEYINQNTKEEPSIPVSDARAKTNELLNLIHDHAKGNKIKGYGTTICSHMLQAYILKVGHNIPKLKGHTVTKEEYETTIRVYKWLLNNGYIKPCAYSVNEDSNIRVYIADYDGKTGNVGYGTTYLPYNATNAAKYTIKKAILFAVK